MKKLKTSLLAIILLANSTFIFGQLANTGSNGLWSNPSIWNPTTVPTLTGSSIVQIANSIVATTISGQNGSSKLTILGPGDTLDINNLTNYLLTDLSVIQINKGGVLIINGNLLIQGLASIINNGLLYVKGNITSTSLSAITGTGAIFTTGTSSGLTGSQVPVYSLSPFFASFSNAIGQGLVTYQTSPLLGFQPLQFTSSAAASVLNGAGQFVPASIFSPWQVTGNNISYSKGNVGIGTTNPTAPLTVQGSALISGVLNSTGLNVSGTTFTLPCLVTDNSAHIVGISGNGTITALSTVDISAILYQLTTGPCSGNGPNWYSQPGINDGLLGGGADFVTKPCTFVGLGEAGVSNFPDAPLSISNNTSTIQLTVVNPTSLTDVFTVDKSGNTNMNGRGTIGNGLSVTSNTAAGPVATFIQGDPNAFPNSQVIITAGMQNTDDYNPITMAGDNGIFWNDNAGSFNNSSGLVIAPHAQSAGGLRIDATGNLAITGNTYVSGNIGIGTTTPNAPLNISTNIATPASATPFQFSILNSSSSFGYNVVGLDQSGDAFFSGNIVVGGSFHQDPAHLVGSSYKVNVQGTVFAQELIVCSGSCDFVFDKDYNLMPLNELEQYLQLNHHLPGIASAKEMESKDGISVGEMNSKLLQKVEELTLYTIDLKKQLDDMQTKYSGDLKKQLDEMQAEIAKLKESK